NTTFEDSSDCDVRDCCAQTSWDEPVCPFAVVGDLLKKGFAAAVLESNGMNGYCRPSILILDDVRSVEGEISITQEENGIRFQFECLSDRRRSTAAATMCTDFGNRRLKLRHVIVRCRDQLGCGGGRVVNRDRTGREEVDVECLLWFQPPDGLNEFNSRAIKATTTHTARAIDD